MLNLIQTEKIASIKSRASMEYEIKAYAGYGRPASVIDVRLTYGLIQKMGKL